MCQTWKFDTPGCLCFLCALAALLQSSIITSLASNVALLLEIQKKEHPILLALRALYDLLARRSNSFFMLVYSSACLLVFSFRNLGRCLYSYVYFLLNMNERNQYIHSHIQVSQEEWTKLRESVPYVKIYRYNPKHLCPKLNGYGDKGQKKVWSFCGSTYCTWFA